MASLSISNLASPSTVSIFAQTPGIEFIAHKQALAPVPSAGSARLDLAETEDVGRTYTVSRNPMQRVVAQNKIRNPDTLTLGGMLSAHPLNTINTLSAIGSAVTSLSRLDKKELAKIRDLCDQELVFIVTPERSYANMTCVALQEHYDDQTGQGVALTLNFEEMLIESPSLTESVLDLDALDTGSGSSADVGFQSAEPTADVSDNMSTDELSAIGI